jgi:hypothetical protein
VSREQAPSPEEYDEKERDGRDSDPELRPLPDGGLGENMPDWLRRPPAWRELPTAEPVQDVPIMDVHGAERGRAVVERDLAPEDTSVIEPGKLIDFEDLPAWLREVGRKPSADGFHAHGGEVDASLEPSPVTGTKMLDEPGTPVSNAFSEGELHAVAGAVELKFWYQGRFIALLVIALAVAIVVTVLFATGAI